MWTRHVVPVNTTYDGNCNVESAVVPVNTPYDGKCNVDSVCGTG
jgi:hypothetical protein